MAATCDGRWTAATYDGRRRASPRRCGGADRAGNGWTREGRRTAAHSRASASDRERRAQAEKARAAPAANAPALAGSDLAPDCGADRSRGSAGGRREGWAAGPASDTSAPAPSTAPTIAAAAANEAGSAPSIADRTVGAVRCGVDYRSNTKAARSWCPGRLIVGSDLRRRQIGPGTRRASDGMGRPVIRLFREARRRKVFRWARFTSLSLARAAGHQRHLPGIGIPGSPFGAHLGVGWAFLWHSPFSHCFRSAPQHPPHCRGASRRRAATPRSTRLPAARCLRRDCSCARLPGRAGRARGTEGRCDDTGEMPSAARMANGSRIRSPSSPSPTSAMTLPTSISATALPRRSSTGSRERPGSM